MSRKHLILVPLAAAPLMMLHGAEQPAGWTASPDVVQRTTERRPEFNFTESKVPQFTLPDPLVGADGARITSGAAWPKRRAEILELFRQCVYGRAPVGRPAKILLQVLETDPQDLGGAATRKMAEISFDTPQAGRYRVRVQVYVPNDAPKPVPTFLLLNFRGFTTEAAPEIVKRGYAIAILDRNELASDNKETFRQGIINAFVGAGDLPDNAWRAIGAWAWGGSRAMDYLETDKDIDANRVAVVGHSRMGKTALWCGAQDTRFSLVISNDSGCGGAALSRRRFGETVERINTSFPHWFCDNFKKYNGKEDDLPVDQHMLISLIAPRLAYAASADEDLWADPRGEFLSCKNASTVYRLLGLQGLASEQMPPLNTPVQGGRIGYHIRSGGHGLTLYDWLRYMDFADQHLRAKAVEE